MDSSFVGVTVDTDFFFNFDPIRGVKTNEAGDLDGDTISFTVISDNTNHKLQVDIGPTGRVRICSPVAGKKVGGYKACI